MNEITEILTPWENMEILKLTRWEEFEDYWPDEWWFYFHRLLGKRLGDVN